MPIDSSMEREPPKSESPAERAYRIAWLSERVASGDYFVPAEVIARSLLRRLGLELLDLQPVVEDFLVVLNRVYDLAHESLVGGVQLITLEGFLVLELHDQRVGVVDLGFLSQPPTEPQISDSGNGREELSRFLQELLSRGSTESGLQTDQYHVADHGQGC